MSIIAFIQILFRFLQGERRGLGTQLKPPTPEQEAKAPPGIRVTEFLAHGITIQTVVCLADVSFWQGVIDFLKMKLSGLFGVFIRAGQRSWDDVKFKINWTLAKLAGIPRGSYWFYDSREDPKKQAARWAGLLAGDYGELPHAADFEESYGGPFGKKEHFKAFLIEFQRLTGLPNDRVIIYTGYFWWIERIGSDLFYARYQLWLASYGSMSQVRIPAPWTIRDLLFWQFTASGDGLKYGVSSKEIDLNWYCCDPAAFAKRFPKASLEIPIPPTQGETMNGKFISKTNMRFAATQHSLDLGDFLAGDLIECGEEIQGADGLKYRLVTKATRAGQPVKRTDEKTVEQAPVYAYSANIQISTTPAPATLPDLPVRVEIGDDVTYAKLVLTGTLKPK